MRVFHGFPIPNISFAMGRIDLVTNVKLRMLQSPVDTVVARMAISTSLSLGAGLSTSLNCRRSGDPYWLCRIAFTSAPGLAERETLSLVNSRGEIGVRAPTAI